MNEVNCHKLVHLDLKGAAPNVAYLSSIFPLFKDFGATGILLEYEDMFPYSGSIHCLSSENSYNVDDIKKIQEIASENKLEVIPLIQTFGHLEFVLKHKEFVHLREVPTYPMTICPCHDGEFYYLLNNNKVVKCSLSLLSELINQVLELHPHTKWLHIGADEVFNIGLCPKCSVNPLNQNIVHLFLQHICRVINYINSIRPDLRVIMWDDMLRGVDSEMLKSYKLGEKTDIMVWYYGRSIDITDAMWDTYVTNFPNIWVASAFKGATRPNAFVTDIGFHIDNHLAWLALLQKLSSRISNFCGFAVTGWQRYDHYAALCELLPVSIPSLALCLAILQSGNFGEELYKKVSTMLGFAVPIPLSPHLLSITDPTCCFPGSLVYQRMCTFHGLEADYHRLVDSDRLSTWMTGYNVSRSFTNPVHMESIQFEAKRVQHGLQAIYPELQSALYEIYNSDTVNEWLGTCLSPLIVKIEQIINSTQQQIEVNTRALFDH